MRHMTSFWLRSKKCWDNLYPKQRIVEWDTGYLVVMAKYNGLEEVEEYMDLMLILAGLYYDADEFLKPIKEVRIDYAV